MNVSKMFVMCLMVVIALGMMPAVIEAEEYKIAVLHANDDAQAYRHLAEHLAKRGLSVQLVEAPTYAALKGMISTGVVDAVFSGPGIPGSMFVIHRLRLKDSLAGVALKEVKVHRAMRSN